MKPELGQRYEPSWLGRPPGMSEEDRTIWKNYIYRLPSAVRGIYYNVALGSGAQGEDTGDERIAKSWTFVTRKRADVVLDLGDRWQIIELRFAATSTAVGRLQIYKMLWLEDPPDNRPVSMALVTDTYDAELARLCEQQGIDYIQA